MIEIARKKIHFYIEVVNVVVFLVLALKEVLVIIRVKIR